MKSRSRYVAAAIFAAAVTLVPRPGLGAAAPDGRKLFTDKTCVVCHAVGAPSKGPGPELTQVTYHRSPEWLRAWLTDPQAIKKGTIMPKPAWKSPEEMDAVIQYLTASRRPIPDADSTDGAKLFADFGCSGCHAVSHRGGKPQFPDLLLTSRSRDVAWLDRWLQDPQAVKQGTFMAKFPLTNTQRKSLVEFIHSLK